LTRTVFSPDTTSGLEGEALPAGHAFITEMFSGIQGEGPYVGVRQIFVRLAGCDLRCAWCDTPRSLVRRGPGKYETSPGSREFVERGNPIGLDEARLLVRSLHPDLHHSVTFTGGEPLLQPEAIQDISEEVHASGGLTWLETHGGRVSELESVVDSVDVISMDLKLRSSSVDFIPLKIHRRFLEIAAIREVYAKVVITPDTSDVEVLDAARTVASVRSDIVLVLQQVTPFARVKSAPTPERMLRLQAMCLGVHGDVRVIPQTHKLTGQL
jgi:7-carboxy-7-deazaguanine synthase